MPPSSLGRLGDPHPRAGELRIRVAFSGVNPGDVKKRENAFGVGMAYPRVIPHSDGAGNLTCGPPRRQSRADDEQPQVEELSHGEPRLPEAASWKSEFGNVVSGVFALFMAKKHCMNDR